MASKALAVAQGGSAAPGRSVAVIYASHQQLLGHRGEIMRQCLWGRDDGTSTETQYSHLAKNCVGLNDLVPPVASLHRDDGQLGQDDGSVGWQWLLLRALTT